MKLKQFKKVPPDRRVYIKGSNLKDGQVVWFRRSGEHYDLKGVVTADRKIRVMPHDETPDYLYGANFGLWSDHKYLLHSSN